MYLDVAAQSVLPLKVFIAYWTLLQLRALRVHSHYTTDEVCQLFRTTQCGSQRLTDSCATASALDEVLDQMETTTTWYEDALDISLTAQIGPEANPRILKIST